MSLRPRYQKICSLVFFCVCPLSVNARSKDIPAHGPAIFLFDGNDLNQFDTFLRSAGLNSDPNHVFVVEKGVVHVSGTEFGYFIAKQEYKDYYLRAEFKWGVGTFAPQEGQARDESAPITVIALSPPVPFHLGKVKSSTSALTRSF